MQINPTIRIRLHLINHPAGSDCIGSLADLCKEVVELKALVRLLTVGEESTNVRSVVSPVVTVNILFFFRLE
jgi:hypothetical protein